MLWIFTFMHNCRFRCIHIYIYSTMKSFKINIPNNGTINLYMHFGKMFPTRITNVPKSSKIDNNCFTQSQQGPPDQPSGSTLPCFSSSMAQPSQKRYGQVVDPIFDVFQCMGKTHIPHVSDLHMHSYYTD